jgi:Sulfatase-modifying factor enzyme 1/PEGA domain
MTTEEAAQILGLRTGATDEERSALFKEQRKKLDQKLAQAPTPGLEAKYREALRRLDEAYETLAASQDHSDLPSLRPDFNEPAATQNRPNAALAAASGLSAESGGKPDSTHPAPAGNGGSRKNWVAGVLVAAAVLILAIWVVPFIQKKQADAEAAQKASETAHKEAERLANARGGLIVKTQPAGALVALGADQIEKSPATFKGLKIGKQVLTITLDNYETIKREVEVKENEFLDAGLIELERSAGTIDIKTAQTGVTYRLVNSKGEIEPRQSAVPAQLTSLPTGDYTLTLTRHGWPDYSEKVTVRAHQTVPVVYEFEQGTMQIHSAPTGMPYSLKIVSNGRVFANGKTPMETLFLPPDEYVLQMEREGWPTYVTNVTIVRGQTVSVQHDFEEGEISVSVDPPGAEVNVGGSVFSSAGVFVSPVGTRKVVARYKNWPEISQEVSVEKGKRAQVLMEFAYGSVKVVSEPSGASVSSGSQELGTTPLDLKEVLAGTVNYTLKLAKRKVVVVSGVVEWKKELVLNAKLNEWPHPFAGERWTNSFGQVFAPVTGVDVLFGIWDVRVKDYRAYAEAASGVDAEWKSPGFAQEETHPVVDVSWDDAQGYCKWLTEKERRDGVISENQSYRLPADWEDQRCLSLGKSMAAAQRRG